MQGFIRKRGSTFTVYWSSIDPATGKRVQRTKGGFRVKEPGRPARGDSAREYLNTIVSSVQDGSWRPDTSITIKSLLKDYWLPAQRSRNLKPKTLAQYENVVDAWIEPTIGGMRAAAITPRDVQLLDEKLKTTTTSQRRSGLSPRSRQMTVGVLKAAFAFALETGLLSRNPISGVRRPTVTQHAPTTWDEDAARAFLVATSDDPHAALWALALTRGLRRGELAGLKWSAIDLTAKTLRVISTLVMVDGRPQVSTPKTTTSARTVPLDAQLVELLREHRYKSNRDLRSLESDEAAIINLGNRSDRYVFTNQFGSALSPDWLSGRFEALVAATGLPHIRLHDCRHTAATLMLAHGVHPKVVQEMLGHSNVSVTLGIYGHVTPTMGAEAGAALSAALLG